MKYTAKRSFRDKYTGRLIKPGDELELTTERYEEITAAMGSAALQLKETVTDAEVETVTEPAAEEAKQETKAIKKGSK